MEEKTILIKQTPEGTTLELNGLNNWEALGLLRFFEKHLWLRIQQSTKTVTPDTKKTTHS